jgi:hypothetical protein
MGTPGTPDTKRQQGRAYGDWFDAQIQANHWNNTEVAGWTGIKRQTVADIRNGAAVAPPVQQIAAVAKLTGATPNEIFEAAGWWKSDVPAEMSKEEREAATIIRSLSPGMREIALDQLRAMRESFLRRRPVETEIPDHDEGHLQAADKIAPAPDDMSQEGKESQITEDEGGS